ncbi:Spectrin beta chain, erythrocytic [Triplophysa tibetana]|uniref:Spectrin beta chain, erythrocytic n=1 Tax=Triplophysa tibetana TaxID=1572043 RepID=A0A5A9NMT0_9TELE|nr:Spectrin beta chain, erythrocytic [Triplophysa tibetana]
MATMTSTTDFDNAEITQQYSRINTRFELSDGELDNDNSSARLFERSRIKALAARIIFTYSAYSGVTELDSCPARLCP